MNEYWQGAIVIAAIVWAMTRVVIGLRTQQGATGSCGSCGSCDNNVNNGNSGPTETWVISASKIDPSNQ